MRMTYASVKILAQKKIPDISSILSAASIHFVCSAVLVMCKRDLKKKHLYIISEPERELMLCLSCVF